MARQLPLIATPPLDTVAICRNSFPCPISLSADDKAPEWIQAIPSGPSISALDGRIFQNTDPAAIVAAFDKHPLDIPIDWEHATQRKAPKGDKAPAAGWIKQLEVRDGSVWARVDWTPQGAADLASKQYRYFSPAFGHDSAGLIRSIVSGGLTNEPAFAMQSVARSTPQENASATASAQHQEDPMDPKLLAMLGLPADATVDQASSAIAAMKVAAEKTTAELATARAEVATARATPPGLDKFVPRADYEVALARAGSAEAAIAESKKASRQKEIDTEIDAALKAGKIVPASKDFYVATCSAEGGLERFRDFVKLAPTIGDPSAIEGRTPPSAEAMTEQAVSIASKCGITKEQYLAELKYERGQTVA